MSEVKTINGPTREDGSPFFARNLRRQWNDACLAAGIPAMTTATSARIMAILLHYGNNEAMVLNQHFTADCEYIQKRFRIMGSQSPDPDFARELQAINAELEACTQPPQWAVTLMQEMYGIKI